MACKAGQRQAVAALCAVMAWSLFVTPAAAMSAALHFRAPIKIWRMSFDIPDYSAAFFEASHIMHLENEHKTFPRFIGSHRDLRSVAKRRVKDESGQKINFPVSGRQRRRR